MRKHLIQAIAIALVIAACGGGDSDTLGVGERDLDRCSLVTTEEAAEWLGDPVSAAPTEGVDGSPDPVTCRYDGANATVLVQVRDGAVFFAEPGSDSRTGEDVEDLGEDAFMDADSLEFLQNDWSVSIGLIGGLPDDGALLEIARIISDRLP